MVGEVSSISLLRDSAKLLGPISSVASAVSLIGLLVSLIANGIVFGIWGLNFFQIATPTDLLMSGANIIAFMFIIISSVLIASIFYAILMKLWASRYGKFQIIKNRSPFVRDLIPIFIFTITLSVSTYIVLATFSANDAIGNFDKKIGCISEVNLFVILLISEIAFTAVILHLYLSNHVSDQFNFAKSILKHWTVLFVFNLIIFLTPIIAYATMSRTEWVVGGFKIECKNTLYSVWIGSESVVVTCREGLSRFVEDDNFSIIPRADLTFTKIIKEGSHAQTH